MWMGTLRLAGTSLEMTDAFLLRGGQGEQPWGHPLCWQRGFAARPLPWLDRRLSDEGRRGTVRDKMARWSEKKRAS